MSVVTFSLAHVPYNSRGANREKWRASTLPTKWVEYSSPVPRHTRTLKGVVTMNLLRLPRPRTKFVRIGALSFAACMLLAEDVFAQSGSSPWVNAVQVLQTAFTGTIATGLALVAIVVGGLMFAFGEGGAKRTMAGIIFGVGMAIGAVNFMSWLFPAT